MSYSGNMPDWHQYNPPQHGRTSTTSSGQNVNSNHLFLSNINPTGLDTVNLSTNERQNKLQQRNEINYPGRNYPTSGISGQSCATSSSSGVHTMAPLSSCVGHYGTSPSRNPMIDGMAATMDPRLAPPVVPLNETDLSHRNNPMSFNPSNNQTTSSSMSGIHGSMTSQTSPVGPMSPGRQGPPYGACKGSCCHPDASLAAYQHWEKYGHYQANTAYRDNMRPGHYPIENRRYAPPDMNIRKDCIDNKELVASGPFGVDNRRNYPEYKYRKDLSRNYPASGLLQTYPMQNYNFSDYQKCPYSVKDYLRRGNTNGPTMNSQNSPLIPKYPEQQSLMVQQKYNSKQLYHNGVQQSTVPNTSTANLPSPLQNSYYNTPIPSREVPRDFSRDYQDTNTVGSRLTTSTSAIHSSYQKYHVYQQKIAMQRYSIENHIRMMSRMPGYQSHPKYQEYMMKYRELARLQQNVDYQGLLQESSKLPSPSGAQIAPINLQFDQNGVLINSNYNPGHFSGMQNAINPLTNTDNPENHEINHANMMSGGSIEQQNHFVKHTEQSYNLSREAENIRLADKATRDRYLIQKNNEHSAQFENLIADVDELNGARAITTAVDTMATTTMAIDNANPKEFANKPELDVRQFLATWDESEDEESMATNLSLAAANDSSSVITTNRSSVVKTNHVEVIEKTPEETNTTEKAIEETTIADANIVVDDSVENIEVTDLKTIEELANSGTIVQCIQTDDDIPTIHIVDRLPNESELTTIQTVYGDVSSLTIEDIAKAPIEIINETPEGTETITLYEADSGVCTKDPECNDLPEDDGVEHEAVVEANVATINDKPTEIIEASKSPSGTVENPTEKPLELSYEKSLTQSETVVDNSTQGIDLTMKNPHTNGDRSNLRKQHSFASEESHNPDDISLPDLPMSECTPISTTLNTPIHSDSEESSDNVANLEISTNPIEIVRNSPIISFTHSPIKIDPYGNLENDRISPKRPHDSLDFDFHQEGNSKNKYADNIGDKSVVENFEITERTQTTVELPVEDQTGMQNEVPLMNTRSTIENKSPEKEEEFYPCSDPLVGMGQSPSMASKQNPKNSPAVGRDITNDIIPAGECSEEAMDDNNVGTSVSQILSPDEIDTGKCPSIIDTEDFQPSDDLDKLCNMSLDDACMMSLMNEDNSRDSRMQSAQLDDHSFTKVMDNILPISDLNVLQSSDDEADKDDDDAWVEVRSLDGSIAAESSVNEVVNNTENCGEALPNNQEQIRSDEELEKKIDNLNAIEKTTNYQKTVINWSQYTKFKNNSQNDSHSTKSNGEKTLEDKPKYVPSIFDVSGDSQSTDFDQCEKQELNNTERLKSAKEYRQEKSCDKLNRIEQYNNDSHSQSNITKINDCSMAKDKTIESHTGLSHDNNFEGKSVKKPIEIAHGGNSVNFNCDTMRSMDNYETSCTVTKSFRRANKETDVQIQVANINMAQTSDDDADGGFEIKINVSRSEKNRCGSKQSQHKSNEMTEVIRKRAFFLSDTSTHSYPASIFNQRRLSMPEEFEPKRPRKINKDMKRRHSGGYNFKSYYQRSTEENSTDRNDEIRNFDVVSKNFTLPTVSEKTILCEKDPGQMSMSVTAPLSSQDDSQSSHMREIVLPPPPPSSTFNDIRVQSDDESMSNVVLEKSKESKRKLSIDATETNISHSNIDDLSNFMTTSSFDITPGPSNASFSDPWNKPSFFAESTSMLDFNNFDVAPNEFRETRDHPLRTDDDEIYSRSEKEVRSKRLDDIERYRNPYATSNSQVADAMEMNLNSVPVYRTKDGKIAWSPNPRYTYKSLIINARQREGYPPVGDLHYSSRSSRNYYERRFHRRRQESPVNETKTWNDSISHNTKKFKLPFERRRFDDPEWTNTTCRSMNNRYDNRRRERNTEADCAKDDRSKLYSDISMPPSLCSIDSSFKAQHYRYSPAVIFNIKQLEKQQRNNFEPSTLSRTKNDVNLDEKCAIQNTIGDSLTNYSLGRSSEILDGTKCNESTKIYNGEELELFSTNVSNISSVVTAKQPIENSIERVSRPDVRLSPLQQDFVTKQNESEKNRNNWIVPHSMNVTMTDDESKDISRNSIVAMKPPPSIDAEQDSQAILTDSGLASSTCTESGKESKRGVGQWERALHHHHHEEKSPKNICATPGSPEHVIENKTETFNPQHSTDVTETFTMSEVSRQTEAVKIKPVEEYNNQYRKNDQEKIIEDNKCDHIPKESKKTKKNVDIAKLTELFLSKNYGRSIDSSTLNGLDLAFPARQTPIKKPLIQINVESIAEDSMVKTQEDVSRPASIFNNEHGSKFLNVIKNDEGPPRRASSDEVESRKRNNSFFEHITSSVDAPMSISVAGTDAMSSIADRNIFDRNIGIEDSHEAVTKRNDNAGSSVTNRLTSEVLRHRDEYIFEKPEIPLIRFGQFNTSAQKMNDIENSEVSTESESHYDDTLSSTQFGSECANSKSNETNTASVNGINFLSASSQEAIDATDLNQVRKNLALCALNDPSATHNDHLRPNVGNFSQLIDDKMLKCVDIKKENDNGKLLTFSGRISSESEDDSNAQDGSPIGNDDAAVIDLSTKPGQKPNRILNFSGRIPSPENQSEYHLPKQLLNADEHRIPSSKIVTVNDEKNLTFAGKIQNERCKSPCISPPITEKIPKFIIKKTDSLSKSSSISQIYSSEQATQQSNETKASSSNRMSLHPKIPKMIIRNVRSRPVTPTIEENAVELTFPKSHDSEQKVFEVKIKLDDTTVKHEADAGSARRPIGVIECKIPKMKIKLEDRLPNMNFKNARVEMCDNNESESSKNNSKVKIRKMKRSNSKEEKSTNKVKERTPTNSDKSERNNTTEKSKESSSKSSKSNQRTESSSRQEVKQEKIPKLKIKKHETQVSSSSPESIRKKHPRIETDSSQKNQKKTSSRHRNSESRSTERPQPIDTDGNTTQSNSEKIPKVIIKRTSPSAEFKCELSKDGTAAMIQSPKWQPEVKLERFKVLDSIAMSPGRVKLPSKMLEIISKEKERAEAFISSRKGMPPLHRSPGPGKRRHSDSESLTKSEKTTENCDSSAKKKTNVIRRLDYDSDSEIFPRIIRRNAVRRIHDDSSLEEVPKTKTTTIIDSSKILMDETEMNATMSQSSSKKLQGIITQSEFEFTSASSSHKKINNSIAIESTVSALVTGNAEEVIVDTKHHNTENSEEPQSVIKLESSDESQTTIEILPASPEDISQPESEVPMPLEGKRRIANGDMAQLYSEDAIPTQFELELEIADNSSESLDVPVPSSNMDSGDESRCVINYTVPKSVSEKRNSWNYPVKFTEDTTACSTSTMTPGPSFVHKTSGESERETTSKQMRNICCSDSLVKEVLAAKETLKRCLSISKHESKSKSPSISRPKTAAEKKQGTEFTLTGLSTERSELEINRNQHHHHVFHESSATSCDVSRNDSIKSKCKKVDRRHSKSGESSNTTDRREKRSKITTDVRRHEESISMCDPSSRDDTLMSNIHDSIRSLKRSRTVSESNEFINYPPRKTRPSSTSTSICLSTENTQTKASETFSKTYESARRSKESDSQPCASPSTIDRSGKMSTYKIPKISKAHETRKIVGEMKIKPMPILEPVDQVNFDATERDTSRSPPVITKQESSNEICPESPKKLEVKGNEKIETIMNQETEAVTFADIVAQMAYHEKATIKHRRYCILCERWFPTAARHRRHLTGYQHRHTELTQRRTVHALFMLFTGKPCPRLLPASIVRTDCAPGEPTPLQIAVQDVAMSLEAGANDKTKNVNGENK